MTDITIQAKDTGSFTGYLATPKSGSGPGILLIQEIFGVNKFMRDTADSLAAEGYTVLCPDLFWRQEPGIQLTDQTEEDWARAFELFQGFDPDKGIDDIAACVELLRAHESCTGKVGCIGFCLGGLLAYLAACRTDIDAVAGYYGVSIQEYVGEAGNIKCPVFLHIACEDGFVPKEIQAAMHEALDDHPLVTLYDYADRDHAFARVGGEHFHETDAALARDRTLALFAEHLGA